MTRPGRLLLVLVLALVAAPAVLRAEEDVPAPRGESVAWFAQVEHALVAGRETGRPIWIALHARPAQGEARWPHALGPWLALYRDPEVVAASRGFACALTLKFLPTDTVLAESPVHVVLDADGRVLAQSVGWSAAPGRASREALVDLLARGAAAYGPVARDAPVLDADAVSRRTPRRDPAAPLRLGLEAPGLRMRLRFPFVLPDLGVRDRSGRAAPMPARLTMTWDDAGPFVLHDILLEPGRALDVPLDVRFDDVEGLREHVTRGKHRLDLYVGPVPDGPRVVPQPVLVGRALVEIDDGTGGGGGGADEPPPQPPPEPPPPEPTPETGDEPPPPPEPTPPSRVEVVEPFTADAEAMQKDDAVVAVRDPDAGTQAPTYRPLDEALPELERSAEEALSRERLAPDERAFLVRYFDALRTRLRRTEGGR